MVIAPVFQWNDNFCFLSSAFLLCTVGPVLPHWEVSTQVLFPPARLPSAAVWLSGSDRWVSPYGTATRLSWRVQSWWPRPSLPTRFWIGDRSLLSVKYVLQTLWDVFHFCKCIHICTQIFIEGPLRTRQCICVESPGWPFPATCAVASARWDSRWLCLSFLFPPSFVN